ncbi:phosphoribosylformylglycinamidine synthase I [Chlamydiota bacterium]
MMKQVKVLILRTAGTNCDQETAFAFSQVGAKTEFLHINSISKNPGLLHQFHVIAIPGGFTYGDDIASGKILANEIKHMFYNEMELFIQEGKLIIGICNGFQVLVKGGFLPNITGSFSQTVTLTTNDCGTFEDRWVYLKKHSAKSIEHRDNLTESNNSLCIWTKHLPPIIELPIAHGEGKFVPYSKDILSHLKKNNQIVFRYVDPEGATDGFPWNPNGSIDSIAGICDPSGRIFGLMPHPERFIFKTHHPRWTREEIAYEPYGLTIFRNGVEYVRKTFDCGM